MKPAGLRIRVFFCFTFLFFAFSWLSTDKVLAEWGSCTPSSSFNSGPCYCEAGRTYTYDYLDPYSNCYMWCCYFNCPYTSWTNVDLSKCQSALGDPQNVCAGGSGSSTSPCGPLDPWGYCYANGCQVKADSGWSPFCKYQYQYSYIECGAVDTCVPADGPYLRAGQCGWGFSCNDGTECRYSGIFKTCCQTVANGTVFTGQIADGSCIGGCRSGNCPSGSAPVICGVSSCVGIDKPCTTAPCGETACRAVAGALPTPIPGAPTQPPSSGCQYCDYTTQYAWCAPNTSACQQVGGSIIPKDKDCYCSDPNTLLCCYPKSSTGCPVDMDIPGTENEVCTQVAIKVRQKPLKTDGSVDCGCAYRTLEVKIVQSPPGSGIPQDYTVCTVTGAASCDQWAYCYWDTSNMQAAPDPRASSLPLGPYPPGYYKLGVFYGGHVADPAAGNYCSDNMCWDYDDTTLKLPDTGEASCNLTVYYPEGDCSPGTIKTEINLSTTSPYNQSGINPDFNSLGGWTKLIGDSTRPVVTGYYQNCCYRSRGDNCDSWDPWGGGCAVILPYEGNFLTDAPICEPVHYEVKATIPIPTQSVGKDEYIVSVYGTGVEAEVAGQEGKDYGYSLPAMRIASGITTAYYQFSNVCSWSPISLKIKPQRPYIDVYLKSVSVDSTHTWAAPPAAFDKLKLYRCTQPPTCKIFGPTTVTAGDTVTYTTIGENAPDGFTIHYAPQNSPLCSGSSWSNIVGTKTLPDDTGQVSGTVTFNQPGTYYVVCNAYNLSAQSCSGNPGTPTNPNCGWLDCWEDGKGNYTDNLLVTVTGPKGWIQTTGGDLYGGSVTSKIPACATEKYLSLKEVDQDASSGIVRYKDNLILGSAGGQVSQEGWVVEGRYRAGDRLSYEYLKNRLSIGFDYDIVTTNGVLYFPADIKDEDGDGISLVWWKPDTTTSLTLDLSSPVTIPSGRKIVIFVGKDTNDPEEYTLTINNNILVEPGGFFSLVVKGDIIFTKEVTQAQGLFLADRNITIQGVGSGGDTPFNGEGSFIAYDGSLRIKRDLSDNCSPAARFKFRPDFLINAPKRFTRSVFIFQEVAP